MGATLSQPTTAGARAYLFCDGTPPEGRVFEGKLRQLQADEAIAYRVVRALDACPPALAARRQQLRLDDDAEGPPFYVEACCTLAHCGIVDEPMVACVDVFDGAVRAHCVSPTKPELGGVILCVQPRGKARTDPLTIEALKAARDGEEAPAADPEDAGGFKLVGGDEYWWIGYPPIISVTPPAETAAAADPEDRDHFMGSFFEKDVALAGFQ